MGTASTVFSRIRIHALLSICSLLFAIPAFAQRRPTIIEPKARTGSVSVRPVKAAPPTKGVLIVLFDYEVPGKVTIESLAGKVLEEVATDVKGQAQFILKRGMAYKVKGSAQGFVAEERKSKVLKATDTVLLKLTATSATLNLINLPQGAEVFLDGETQSRQAIGESGAVAISDLAPGRHKLTVKHPDYRDYQGEPVLKAGTTMLYPVALDKVAKLTIQSLPAATILIDGALQGKVEADGKVSFDYGLTQNSEHSIQVELLGYQTWSQRMMLMPGPRTIAIKLDPIITSAGLSDFFDHLLQWTAPASWKIIGNEKNKKLQVRGEQLGRIANKVYRDFQVNFTVWLDDGKGATWAVRADPEGRNYYLFHLSGPSSTAYTPRRFYTFLVTDGGAPVEVSTPVPIIPDLNNNASYTINITIRGNQVKHTITSNVTGITDDMGIWTDTSVNKEKFLYGTFGFRCLAGEAFTVDDLSLEPAKEP